MRLCAAIALLLTAGGIALAQPSWKSVYYYDEDETTLRLRDLRCTSGAHCFAVGAVVKNDDPDFRETGVLTSDGGKSWSLIKLPNRASSAFFLDSRQGWLAAGDRIHKSEDGGATWKSLGKVKGTVLRIHFIDPLHGYAVGAPKAVWETKDGGKTWTKVPAAAEPKANEERSAYTTIEWITPLHGVIVGQHQPELPPFYYSRPDWMDPERARSRRQLPSLTLFLETVDGGKTWKTSTTSIFGNVTRFPVQPGGFGLQLVEFQNYFEWPSEVYRVRATTSSATRVFRLATRAITDVAVLPDGRGYLAGYDVQGKLARLVPGKLVIYQSADLTEWTEMEVDYRAVAGRAFLSRTADGSLWAATDQGMILRFTQ